MTEPVVIAMLREYEPAARVISRFFFFASESASFRLPSVGYLRMITSYL
jgi:hypothetical protein